MARSATDQLKQARGLQQRGKYAEAERAYRTILSRNPQNIEAEVRLGVLLRLTGRLAEAVQILQGAARKRPDHLGAVGELGSTLVVSGKFGKAEQVFRSLIEKQPRVAAGYLGLGQTLLRRGEKGKALEVLTQAVELAPRDANVLHELGWAYQQSGQSNRALEYLEKAHKQDAQSPMILKSYGQVLHVVGRIAEAQEHLENARRKNPNDLGAVIYLSELYQALGMLDEGKALLEGAVQRGQRQPTILVGLARIERQQKNVEKALGYLEGISSGDSTLPVQTRAAAEFELGAIREQMGEFGAAFTAYESANGLLNYKYNPRGTTQQVDALIAAYSVEACSEMTRSGDVSELPIFVLGMPRSGTTLVEQIVAAHAQAAGGGELGYFGQACQPLMSDASGGAGGWNPSQMLRLDTETLAQSAVGYLERLRTHGDGVVTRITDKMPTNFFYVGSIAQLLGGARIVHCRRHPLDTCLSIFATPLSPALGFSTDLRALGHFYGEYARLMAHWRSVMDELGIGWLELDYEDLIADAELKSRELIDFCGLTWEDDCLEFHKVKRTVSTASIHQVRQPIYGSSVARWKRFERELAPLVEALGDLADS